VYLTKKDKPRQGVVANPLTLQRSGAVGFIDWLDGFIDKQDHVLNAFATAVSNDNIPIAKSWAAAEFHIGLITAIHRAIPRPNMM
jgi:hypothetical protein